MFRLSVLILCLFSVQLAHAAECPVTMSAPLYACKNGTATGAVPQFPGASYNWTIEGASLSSGAGTNRITVTLSDAPQARLTCVIVRPECTSTAVGVINVREPLAIGTFTAPHIVDAKTPVTINWTYAGTTQPVSQILTGDALGDPVVLPAAQRSYTFVAESSGQRTVELLASYTAARATPDNRPSKRRSAGSVAAATSCPDARASARIEVRGCAVRTPQINAPENIEVGSTFEASVSLLQGETAVWSVENGTILSTHTGGATVRADQEGTLNLSVRVERDPSCFAEGVHRVTVTPPAPQCPVTPTARVELVERSCDKATIRATFTGRAPFHGRWSDGVSFTSPVDSITREVTAFGNYTILDFRGDQCPGDVTGTAEFEQQRGTATLSLRGGSCTNATVHVQFTGKPPFEGVLYRGGWQAESFTTNDYEMEIDPEIAGTYWIDFFRDSCPAHSASNRVDIVGAAPVLVVPETPACSYYGDGPIMGVNFDWGPPPYTVYWADGTITQSDSAYLQRQVPLPDQPIQYYDIVRATTGNCEAVIPNNRASVTFRRQPRIDNNLAREDAVVCPGKTGSVHLANANELPANATLVWEVENGKVVSGQGTPTITFEPVTSSLLSLIKVRAEYPDDACESFDQLYVAFPGDPVISNLRFDPPVIKAGGTSTLRFSSTFVAGFGAMARDGRSNDLGTPECSNYGATCSVIYKDTHGPGSVPVDIQYSGECTSGPQTVTVTLTIEP